MILGVLFDVAVWYYSKDVVLFSSDENSEESDQSKKTDTELGEAVITKSWKLHQNFLCDQNKFQISTYAHT